MDDSSTSRDQLPIVNEENEVPEFAPLEDESAFWATYQLDPDLLRTLERRSLVELLEVRAAADRRADPEMDSKKEAHTEAAEGRARVIIPLPDERGRTPRD